MVFYELFGVVAIGMGVYAIARPMSVRGFPSAREWQENPEHAEQEQQAYASMGGFFLVLVGLILLAGGLLGAAP